MKLNHKKNPVKLTNTTFKSYKIKLTTTNYFFVSYHSLREKKND